MSMYRITELPKILAILLVEQGSYTYIDKLAQSTSKDLALYHIREALRDYHSLLSRGISNDAARDIAGKINFSYMENEIREIKEVLSVSDLRERVSFLSSQALIEAARMKTRSAYDGGEK
ncbi:MAG: type I-A CRISPR-associated protein Csa5 [Nitrososphaeria archaeon]